MAQNGTAVQQSRSRSGLLVAKEMLDDKLSDDGKVRAKSFDSEYILWMSIGLVFSMLHYTRTPRPSQKHISISCAAFL